MVKNLSLHIVFILFSCFAFGQGPYVKLTISPKTIEVNQPISITIKTNINGKINLNIPGGFTQVGGINSGSSTSFQFINGKNTITQNNIRSLSGYFGKKGAYLFGPVTVKDGKKEYKSNTVMVKVIDHQNMISENPVKNLNKIAFGIIQQSKKTVYVGQAFVLDAKAYSQAEILNVKDYAPFSIEGTIEKHSLSSNNQVNVKNEIIGQRQVQTFHIGKTVYFPSKPGVLKVNPFKTSIIYDSPRSFFPQQLNITSNATTIRVLPLPAGQPNDFINAVGHFSITANLHTRKVLQGNVVELNVSVRGNGNLQNISEPKIILPDGFNFYGDTETKDSISYSSIGAVGSKTFTYFIQCNKSGNLQLPPIEISYFNPNKRQYERAKCILKSIIVSPNPNGATQIALNNKEKITSPQMQPYIAEASNNSSPAPISNLGKILLFSPIMLGAFVGFFVLIRDENKERKLMLVQKGKNKVNTLHKLKMLDLSINNKNAVEELSLLFIQFLSKEFNVSNAAITKSFLRLKTPSEISPEIFNAIESLFNEIDTLRFGGTVDHSNLNELKNKIEQIVNTISV